MVSLHWAGGEDFHQPGNTYINIGRDDTYLAKPLLRNYVDSSRVEGQLSWSGVMCVIMMAVERRRVFGSPSRFVSCAHVHSEPLYLPAGVNRIDRYSLTKFSSSIYPPHKFPTACGVPTPDACPLCSKPTICGTLHLYPKLPRTPTCRGKDGAFSSRG